VYGAPSNYERFSRPFSKGSRETRRLYIFSVICICSRSTGRETEIGVHKSVSRGGAIESNRVFTRVVSFRERNHEHFLIVAESSSKTNSQYRYCLAKLLLREIPSTLSSDVRDAFLLYGSRTRIAPGVTYYFVRSDGRTISVRLSVLYSSNRYFYRKTEIRINEVHVRLCSLHRSKNYRRKNLRACIIVRFSNFPFRFNRFIFEPHTHTPPLPDNPELFSMFRPV